MELVYCLCLINISDSPIEIFSETFKLAPLFKKLCCFVHATYNLHGIKHNVLTP